MNARLEGLLLVDKPIGPTSHDIVGWVRRATGQRRIGHTGTLDPPASGLLVLALGNATRLIRFLPEAPKHYEGTIALGVQTDTDDLAGNVLEQYGGPLPDFAAVSAAGKKFLGHQDQIPPAVSARKVDGQRLYRLARQGRPTIAAATPIDVTRFDLTAGDAAGRIEFRAEVSKGTYIRSLARDLGASLGCGGALARLRRSAIGPFLLADACPPPEQGLRGWVPERLIAIDDAPLVPPALVLSSQEEVQTFRHGVTLDAAGVADGWVRALDAEGRLLGLGEVAERRLKPRVVLATTPT